MQAQLLQSRIDRHAFRDPAEVEPGADRESCSLAGSIHLNTAPPTSRLHRYRSIETNRRKVVEGAIISQVDNLIEHGWIIHALCRPGSQERRRQNVIE